MTVDKKTALYVGGGLILLVGGALLFSTNKPDKQLGADTFTNNNNGGSSTPANNTNTPPPPPPPLNKNLVLKKGSKGREVVELQKLLNITADGIFGPQTEAKLFSVKGVKQITLNQWNSIASVNPNGYAVNTKLMANVSAGAVIYKDEVKADGTHYSPTPLEEETTIDYGDHVGIVKGFSPGKNWYLIQWSGFFGTNYGWVKASEVKSYN